MSMMGDVLISGTGRNRYLKTVDELSWHLLNVLLQNIATGFGTSPI